MNVEGVLDVAVNSDPGLVRSHNEDSSGADLQSGLLVVADGMGGYRAGEVASAIAVTATVRSYRSGLRGLVDVIENGEHDPALSAEAEVLADAFRNANSLILDTAAQQPEYQGMGTTVVGMCFHDDTMSVAHVGDSRAYRLRAGQLEQLTNDHTVRQELIDRGLYTRQEADAAISRNLVTRALGIDPDIKVDVTDHDYQRDDLFLLCTDGLNDMITDEHIHKLLLADERDLQSCANTLVEAAKNAGGDDNVSVLLARVRQRPAQGASLLARLQSWLSGNNGTS